MMKNKKKEQMLEKVKKALGIEGEYQDDTISVYIDEVLMYAESSGVPTSILNSEKMLGLLTCGVSDLWNLNSGNKSFSPYFMQRLIQLKNSSGDKNV